jgi:uncharacterized protein
VVTLVFLENHPLVAFFSPEGETLENYLAIDDLVVWGAIHQIARRGKANVPDIAIRLVERKKPLCLDVQVEFPEEPEKQRRLKHRLNHEFHDQIGTTVFRDLTRLSLYGEIGGDDDRAQKRLMIKLAAGTLKEITSFTSSTITSRAMDRPFERYYFIEEALRKQAQTVVEQVRGHP